MFKHCATGRSHPTEGLEPPPSRNGAEMAGADEMNMKSAQNVQRVFKYDTANDTAHLALTSSIACLVHIK